MSFSINTEGSLKPGSYNVGIALLDEDLNSTEVISTSETIKIFTDGYSSSFETINGSTSEVSAAFTYGETSKGIEVNVSNLDSSYSYYRLYLIEANVSSGEISRIGYTDEIPVEITSYTLTGNNTPFLTSVEDVQQKKLVVSSASHIEQIDNRLLLANTKGTKRKPCLLQSYASKIKTDLTTAISDLNDISKINNQKRGTVNLEKVGYMPGEIYALGIVYTFADGEESPAFHIPGRSPLDDGEGQEMSLDNKCESVIYTSNDCDANIYWGKDHLGNDLTGEKVRHHRFPLRSDRGPGTKLYGQQTSVVNTGIQLYKHELSVTLTGNRKFNEGYRNQSWYEDSEDDQIYVRVQFKKNGGDSETAVFSFYDGSYLEDDEVNITINLPSYIDSNSAGYSIENVGKIDLVKSNGGLDTGNDAIQGGRCTVLSGFGSSGGNYCWDNPEITNTKVYNKKSDYDTVIFGLNFSNIELPPDVVGYHIVRMERTDQDRTILDSGILTPMIVEEDNDFIAFGHLHPRFKASDRNTRISKNYYAFTNPDFKFRGKEWTNYDEILVEGNYTVDKNDTVAGQSFFTETLTQDVAPGTSYDPEVNKKKEKDEDGFSLRALSRYSEVTYNKNAYTIDNDNDYTITYLNALSEVTKDGNRIFNASSDNKIGIIETSGAIPDINTSNKIPFVYLKRNIADPYSLFRLKPYYKEHTNLETGSSVKVYNGDSYVSSMTYTSSMFYDIRLRKRKSKGGTLKIILSSLLVVAAASVAILSLGAGAPLSAVMVGAAGSLATSALVGAVGFGISAISAGISQSIIKKAYEEAYEEGLRDCIDDEDTSGSLESASNIEDDEIQWLFDHLSSVFFESTININHRVEPNFGPALFLNSPAHFKSEAVSSYAIDKVTSMDTEKGGRNYNGYAFAEVYKINKDYYRTNKEKIYFPLGLEYDCCNDCQEEFPNRVHWSDQSFQEELSDNFRSFLPNNYRDIEGVTGAISDLFKMQNNVYIHTEEGLWHLPQNIQERITGDVTSFIGTGEYFSIPPRRIVDDATGMSAGTRHKWATIKTPYGVFFVCEEQGMLYKFNGNNLDPISSKGMFNWFKNNSTLIANFNYKNTKGRSYPYNNNPSNPFGVGFISVYDSRKERIIFTKKDYIFADTLNGGTVSEDWEVYYHNGNLSLFQDYNRLITEGEESGNIFVGIINNVMRFERYNASTDSIDVFTASPEKVVSEAEIFNNSWTMSYSLKSNSWTSWHSYLPNFYYSTPDNFYSWLYQPVLSVGENQIYRHNELGSYQLFYGELKPFIAEYISLSNAISTRVWECIKLLTEAKKYDFNLRQFVDERYITFNKGIFYNSRQCSGEMELIVKDTQSDPTNYMLQQVEDNTPNSILLDRNERDWSLNELRDLRVDYTAPIFNSKVEDLQTDYYIDKLINSTTIDYDKNWNELESFRDKYLAIRLIFDNFDDIKLLLNYSIENEIISPR